MARRSFDDVFDLIELLTHWHAGRSQRQLADSLGIDRKTIAKYLAPAIAESLTPGGEPVTETAWAAHVARWFPEVADPGLRATTWPGASSRCETLAPTTALKLCCRMSGTVQRQGRQHRQRDHQGHRRIQLVATGGAARSRRRAE